MAGKTELSASRTLRFGVFQVNLAARELRKHGVRIRLPGQSFCVLSILLERSGQVVSREALRDKLWEADTFVDYERSLNSAIRKLRAVLGDSQESPRYIETVPRMGYRFIAPVEEISSSAESPLTGPFEPTTSGATAKVEELPARRWSLILGIPAILLTMAAGYFMWSQARTRPQPSGERLMLAVLPFENLTGDPAQDYLSDGLTEEMIAQLGHLDPEHLGVIARTSVMHYKHTTEQAGQIGRELGVQYVLEGSLRRESDRVRITAQLVQMKDQTHIWSRQYDRELKSLLALQAEIAQETADEIEVALGRGRTWTADRKLASPSSYQAYDLYLKGRYFWNKRTKDGFQQAADYFQQSIAIDPNYARAYAGLADTFALMTSWSFVPQTEAIPKARAAALRALQLDDSLAEAHTSLALVAEIYDYDWQTAEKEYRRAIQLDPQYATAHQWYAECLSFQGRFPEALEESERARQLDPLSLIIATDHAAILYFARQYDRAIEQFRAVIAMEPNFARAHMVVYAYVEKGMFPEALAETSRWSNINGSPVWELEAYVYGRWGKQQQAERAFARWKRGSLGASGVGAVVLLQAYIATGRKEEALALIERSYREHPNLMTSLKVEPALDPLRGDPRFQELLRRVGLADR